MHPLLEQIINTNNQIIQLVDSMQWDKILLLSNKRDKCLRQYFEIEPLPDNNSVISQVINDMTDSDQKIAALISGKKSEMVSEGLSLRHSHNAIQRYRHTQTG